jgi:hypothetical protein
VPPIDYFNSMRLALEMGVSQSHAQELIRKGKIQEPDAMLHGCGVQNAQYGYTMSTIKKIAQQWKAAHK